MVIDVGRPVKRRHVSSHSAKSVICIRTEGENTEPVYFDEFLRKERIPRSIVDCRPSKGSSPISVVNDLIKAKNRNRSEVRKGKPKIDEYWAVFDTEGERPRLEEAIQLAKSQGIHCAISAPSFEYWILLHYEKTSRPFTKSKQVERILAEIVPGGYSKTSYNAGDVLSRLPEAKKNISLVRKELGKRAVTDLPNTNVDEPIAFMEENCR